MSNNQGGIGILGVLTLIFVTLKLVGVINWSWWWVLSPTLVGVGFAFLVLFFLLLGFIVAVVHALIGK